jgi:hypothetical protein
LFIPDRWIIRIVAGTFPIRDLLGQAEFAREQAGKDPKG